MISWVIPYYEVDEDKKEVLKKCVDSASGYDELILVWNDGMGYAPAINRGLALAKGDFIVVSNDDLIFKHPFTNLIDETAVTSPVVDGRVQEFWGCCFCIPRWVYEKVGGLDERYDISYFDDDDYQMTLRQHSVPMKAMEKIHLSHPEGGRTLHKMEGWERRFKENQIRFKEKWGVGRA